jgi:hypothetical protein
MRVAKLVKKFLAFKEQEDLLQCSQEPATGHYSGPDEFIPHSHTRFL